MTKITQAFIFAAGRGERMRPLTDNTPKPLIKINGKAIIDYTIEKLDRDPYIKKIIINGFYLSEQIEEHIKNLNNPKIIFSHEVEKVETGGGLVFAKEHINLDEPLLTINGDILWQDGDGDSDIETISKAWDGAEFDILLGLKKTDDYLGYRGNVHGGGDFNLTSSGKLLRFPDMAMNHVYVGLQIINPKILKNAPEKNFPMSYFYKHAVGEGGLLHRVNGVELNGRYFHIGTVDAVLETEENL